MNTGQYLKVPYDISVSSLSNQDDQSVLEGNDKVVTVTWSQDATISATAVDIENTKLWMRLIQGGVTKYTENTTIGTSPYRSNSQPVTIESSTLGYGSYILNTTLIQQGSNVTLGYIVNIFNINPPGVGSPSTGGTGGVPLSPVSVTPVLVLGQPDVQIPLGGSANTTITITLDSSQGITSYTIKSIVFEGDQARWITIMGKTPILVKRHDPTFNYPKSHVDIQITPDANAQVNRYTIPFTATIIDSNQGTAESKSSITITVTPPFIPQTIPPETIGWGLLIGLLGAVGTGMVIHRRRNGS
ncbi:MAG: hypothetical protein ABIH76_03465 [Candidatus Bathyarchaeota archaeon]